MHDPFKITQPTCISFSGGRTSAYMLWRVLQANGGLPADTVVCFANTGKEVEATLRFVRDCAAHWQVPIHWLEYLSIEPGFTLLDFDRASRREGTAVAALRRWHHLQRQVRRGGGQHQIVRAVQDACEDAFLRVEEFAEVVAAQLGARQLPPVVKRVGIRVAADGIGQQLHAAIGTALSLLGEEVHALVLGEDDAALVGNGLGQHGAQVGAFESQ